MTVMNPPTVSVLEKYCIDNALQGHWWRVAQGDRLYLALFGWQVSEVEVRQCLEHHLDSEIDCLAVQDLPTFH